MVKDNWDFLGYSFGLSLFLKINELLLLIIPTGTLVRVNYPAYVAGLIGVIQAHEKGANRWIIKLQNNPFKDNHKPILLSLESLDFVVLELPSFVENTDNDRVNE